MVSNALGGGWLGLTFNVPEATEDSGVGEEVMEGPGRSGRQAPVVGQLVVVVSVRPDRGRSAHPVVSDAVGEAARYAKKIAPAARILD